ncbi:MAG: CrcB family protein [Myxococcota bacterium]
MNAAIAEALVRWVVLGGAIAAGGALGAVVRGGLLIAATTLDGARARSRATALAVLLANLGACALLGLLLARTADRSGATRGALAQASIAFATTGLCGSLSTFSTICADLVQVAQARRFRLGTLYLLAHLVGGPLALGVGLSWRS